MGYASTAGAGDTKRQATETTDVKHIRKPGTNKFHR